MVDDVRHMPDRTGTGGEISGPVATVSSAPAQTMEGFGASGAWWPIDLARFRPDVQEQVGALLFGPPPGGIQLSVYRYNIGGGGTGVRAPSRAPETFLVRPGAYDWERDVGGRLFLRMAAGYGVPVLVGFVNSAPAIWTTTGTCTGGALVPGTERLYAGYLADVVTRFHDADGIAMSYVSPMNEPDYTFEGGGQEGMAVPVDQRAAVVGELGAILASRAPYAQVIADESSQVGSQFLPEVPGWMAVDGTPRRVAALAHHLYDFPDDSTLQSARRMAARLNKPLWMTEICCARSDSGTWGRQYDPTIAGGLVLANLVWKSLTQAGDAAFHWWVALSSALGADLVSDPEAPFQVNGDGWNDGLLYYDPDYARTGDQRIFMTKRYHVLGQFSRYVRPGARRHDVAGAAGPLRLLAFSGAGAWTIVAINNAAASAPPSPMRVQLPEGGGGPVIPVETVETSALRSLEHVRPPQVSVGGRIEAMLPAQSITTFVFRFR